MNYGFVIDNRSCIGCHACSTACKSENEVPLGVYRTWVKTTESGTWPDTQRQFQVTRCNHCEKPPCVAICPTAAMYKRDDGIVEFDSDACIGCKACLQACPYDAVHIDPDTGTAAKCHYCSHRVEVGLEPSCVVVCPTHAIIAGDLDDPDAEISQVLAKNEASVRRPEQGTQPNVFYIDGASVNLDPLAAELPESYAAADVIPTHEVKRLQKSTAPTSSNAGQMVQVGYNAQHRVPWHWPVPAYLVTKGIAAGAFMLMLVDAIADTAGGSWYAAGAGLVVAMLLATTALLVYDLEHPERFLYILKRPQWKSWLTRGAVLLIGFSVIATVHLGLELFGDGGSDANSGRLVLLALGAPFALGAAVYTAFLFGQAEGRDLWQSPLLSVHMFVQAVLGGAAAMAILHVMVPDSSPLCFAVLFVAIAADLLLIYLGELGGSHATDTAAQAAHEIRKGRHSKTFNAAILLGRVLPVWLPIAVFLLMPAFVIEALAFSGLLALVGLYLYEQAYVTAPQEVPNS
ncbi:MAG: 4Fe-4S dicluster domain-containing protein [Planctomycetota bacterium]|jgi:Fe-S-cluster-containing dehydrogenase component/formate-dependent nitrite reductase membrane component NrfD